jgi:predicted nucleic acid-binding protein
MILLDTNILGRVTNPNDAQCAVARKAVNDLRTRGEELVIVPQNLFEFWAVATRPAGSAPGGQNGLGMSLGRANLWCKFFLRRFILLPDRAEIVPTFLELVNQKQVGGHKSHDVRLVAAMKVHGVRRIITFNAKDFAGMDVEIVDPRGV